MHDQHCSPSQTWPILDWLSSEPRPFTLLALNVTQPSNSHVALHRMKKIFVQCALGIGNDSAKSKIRRLKFITVNKYSSHLTIAAESS